MPNGGAGNFLTDNDPVRTEHDTYDVQCAHCDHRGGHNVLTAAPEQAGHVEFDLVDHFETLTLPDGEVVEVRRRRRENERRVTRWECSYCGHVNVEEEAL